MSPQRPQDLVFTLFGDYLLHRDGAVWVGTLIKLLRPLGLSAGATRTVLSRMASKGWLGAERVGRRSYYALTARGRRLLEAGEARIYRPPREEPWDGLWYLVAYSIPEEQRRVRDRLRVRLQWLGFGQLGNGLWLSPHQVRAEVTELAAELGVTEHVEIFRAHYQGHASTSHLVAQCWDLQALDGLYVEFLERHRAAFEALRSGSDVLTPVQAFVRRFWLVHEYRAFPLLDPYLPAPLLPEDWHGEAASALFEAYHDLLTAPAERYVESVLELHGGSAAARGA